MTSLEIKNKLLCTHLINDNEYLNKYVQLIRKNQKNKFNVYTSQRHHILPRCYFKFTKQKIDNTKSNLVNLLYKDHLLAHYYLCLCANDDRFFYANFLALKFVLSTIEYWDQKLSANELKLQKELDKIQKIYERQRSYIKGRDLNYYNKFNELIFSGKNGNEIAQYFNLSIGGCFSKYSAICKRNNLEQVNTSRWFGNELDFYNFVNKSASEGKFIEDISNKYNKNPETVLNKYLNICKKNHFDNIYRLEKIKFKNSEEIKWISEINKMLADGHDWRYISRHSNTKTIWWKKYYRLLKKHKIQSPSFNFERKKTKKELQKEENDKNTPDIDIRGILDRLS